MSLNSIHAAHSIPSLTSIYSFTRMISLQCSIIRHTRTPRFTFVRSGACFRITSALLTRTQGGPKIAPGINGKLYLIVMSFKCIYIM